MIMTLPERLLAIVDGVVLAVWIAGALATAEFLISLSDG